MRGNTTRDKKQTARDVELARFERMGSSSYAYPTPPPPSSPKPKPTSTSAAPAPIQSTAREADFNLLDWND